MRKIIIFLLFSLIVVTPFILILILRILFPFDADDSRLKKAKKTTGSATTSSDKAPTISGVTRYEKFTDTPTNKKRRDELLKEALRLASDPRFICVNSYKLGEIQEEFRKIASLEELIEYDNIVGAEGAFSTFQHEINAMPSDGKAITENELLQKLDELLASNDRWKSDEIIKYIYYNAFDITQAAVDKLDIFIKTTKDTSLRYHAIHLISRVRTGKSLEYLFSLYEYTNTPGFYADPFLGVGHDRENIVMKIGDLLSNFATIKGHARDNFMRNDKYFDRYIQWYRDYDKWVQTYTNNLIDLYKRDHSSRMFAIISSRKEVPEAQKLVTENTLGQDARITATVIGTLDPTKPSDRQRLLDTFVHGSTPELREAALNRLTFLFAMEEEEHSKTMPPEFAEGMRQDFESPPEHLVEKFFREELNKGRPPDKQIPQDVIEIMLRDYKAEEKLTIVSIIDKQQLVDLIIEKLKTDPSDEVRDSCIRVLSHLATETDEKILQALRMAATQDPSEQLREQAQKQLDWLKRFWEGQQKPEEK